MSVSTAATVSVRVLLFASYAEVVGRQSLELSLPAPATVGALIRRLRELPGGAGLPERPLVAVNHAHARPDSPLSERDEIAILPPLAGG
ncbi:MAG TPA: MoaD/ThiS family protein [Gemmatimonadales bacterium]|nr:MoaD/ThiS family protein [Gemmatimonadales bacterium]